MRWLASESLLPMLELDISDSNIIGSPIDIADWMTQTGGLWAR